MHRKFILLIVAACQVAYSLQCERPHVKYFSRWTKQRPIDSYDDHPLESHFKNPRHHTLDHDCLPHDDIKPVREEEREVPIRNDSFLRDENSLSVEEPEDAHIRSLVSFRGRPRHSNCELFINPIRPPYEGPIDVRDESRHEGCEIFVNPIRPPFDGPDHGHEKPRHEGCEIFVNPIRPPFQGHDNQVHKESLSVHSSYVRRPDSDLSTEEDLHTNSASPSSEMINLHHGSLPGRLTNEDIQESIANAGVNEQIKNAAWNAEANLGRTLVSSPRPIDVPHFLPSGEELPFIRSPLLPQEEASLVLQSSALPQLSFPSPALPSPALPSPSLPSPNVCIRHRLVPVPVRVVEDCITNVPVVRKTVRHQVETITRHVPVVQKTVTQQNEKIVRHVPVAGKTVRNVVETRVRHIPVIKSRIRTVVEPYTVHVPVTIQFTRPVEESITKTIPIQEVRTRPVITERTRLVPVIRRRLRPVVEESVVTVPVKRKYLRTVVEQRVRPVVGPCQSCFHAQPIGLPMTIIPAEDIPRVLLSPYSDFEGSTESSNSQLASFNAQFETPADHSSSTDTFLSGSINGQIAALTEGRLATNVRESSFPLSLPPSANRMSPSLHHSNCPPPPSC